MGIQYLMRENNHRYFQCEMNKIEERERRGKKYKMQEYSVLKKIKLNKNTEYIYIYDSDDDDDDYSGMLCVCVCVCVM